ncbi:(4Fe-4S)-binding protein [Archaeoglobales archaeon]|nr:MAG: (4Fe-4S)-binding protein [Archaeoglobales archaeon]
MKRITVVSGKGGTGKTTIAAMFSYLASREGRIVIADADVDAPNLPILLRVEKEETKPYFGMQKAKILRDKCTECGLCEELCSFDAIEDFEVDLKKCEGCRLCYEMCPVNAIEMIDNQAGEVYISNTSLGKMVHGLLFPGEENSGKLVTEVKEIAQKIAEDEGCTYIVTDGPPGIGCPVIASLNGTDVAVVVAEPTLAAISDFERIVELCRRMNLEVAALINKSTINPELTSKIKNFCSKESIHILGEIPYDKSINEQVSALKFPFKGNAAEKITECWNKLIGGD